MMLCNSDEKSLDELKTIIQSVERSLFYVIKDSRVLCGGGCFEAQMTSYIRGLNKSDFNDEDKFKYKSIANISEGMNIYH